ncbi:CRISPR-associated endonuclease Cas1 [Pelotomaculum isophthalicicum JI]|uniref:CRISPR-associated endonuclease Cas1 n=1 Tax=Pelotomaculum isophthalicicum JI TaxID=947010 RepID=A0A9X4H5T6_9FIRM|nr:CRISPR-associated endonuclease Cas1 [Pelotomaculum isophthalicicum]MDF9408702.1 CRISPR-associated endonuclease Cas1 [Pelotomaculum isophthalicicum JI]
MELLVTNYGSFLGKKSERLILKENGKVVNEIPFHDLEQVIIDTPGASLSTDMIRECVEHGVQISFLTSTGKPFAKLVSPYLTGTVITRREQLLAFFDERGVSLSKLFITGKLKNQINVLKYFSKYRKGVDRELFETVYRAIDQIEQMADQLNGIKGRCIDDVRGQLMSVEGRAGNLYWQGVKLLTGEKVNFPGREHRDSTDPVNSLLNYGYGMLSRQVEGALILAGLDPFGGFLHVDRPGKLSLVYDFVEEFRQQVVDRVVVAMVNKGIAVDMEEGMLSTATKQYLSEKINERLESQEKFQGKKYKLRTIIQSQARRVATFLRGEAKYRPFVGGW